MHARIGVELGDVIAEALNLQGNGTRLSETRRNKYKMGERVRACGVRGVRQFIAYSLKDIRSEMAKSYDLSQPFTVVIKPCASAGSDGVYKCTSMSELEMYFQEIVGETNMLGNVNSSVVVQEYLEGKEYVCDSVSVDGHVKFVTVWEYDKRTANGKNFIYFGMRMMSGEGKIERQLMAYMRGVLKALDIKNGPAHAEVIMTPTGPCLVEVGSRCHGGEGSWVSMVNAALGYSQVKVTVDACINQKAFALIPDTPSQPKMFGVEFFFVSRQEGTLKAMPRLHEIEQLPSFLKADMMIKEGDKIVKTVDCITRPGSVRLLHSSKAQVEKDYEVLRQMEQDGFFIVE